MNQQKYTPSINEYQLRCLISEYKIKVVNELGQLIYLDKKDISLRSILLCANFVIRDKIISIEGDKPFIKGFIDRWIFNEVYDKEIIDENVLPPQLEFYLEIDDKNKTILIKPKY